MKGQFFFFQLELNTDPKENPMFIFSPHAAHFRPRDVVAFMILHCNVDLNGTTPIVWPWSSDNIDVARAGTARKEEE